MFNHFINNQNIMKTYQLILAAALVAITGCTKSNVVNNVEKESNEIGFQTVVRKATKANNAIISGTTYDTDGTNSFNVWGWLSQTGNLETDPALTADLASNFMTGLKIEWTRGRNGETSDTPLAWRNKDNYYYWPFTGAIGFLAVHPSTVSTVSASWDAANHKAKATIADYAITADSKTTDLMFAYASGSRTSGLTEGKLGLTFAHALSQIQFRIRTNEDYSEDVTFTVNSITLNNIDLSGDLAYGWGEITPAVEETPAVMGFKFVWTDNTDQDDPWAYYSVAQNAVYPTDGLDANAATYGNANVMIPQLANTLGESDEVETTITINYTMTPTIGAAATGDITVSAPHLWEAGKKYMYTLNFKLNEILFDPTVTNWVTVNVDTINIFD